MPAAKKLSWWSSFASELIPDLPAAVDFALTRKVRLPLAASGNDFSSFVSFFSELRSIFPVPRLLVHGPNKAMSRTIRFEPIVTGIALIAADGEVVSIAVFMIGESGPGRQIEAWQLSVVAVA